MKKMIALCIVVLCSGLVAFFFFFHLVRASDGFHVIPKNEPAFINTFLDTRDWGLLDYMKYPNVSQALVADKWADMSDDIQKSLHNIQQKAENALQTISRKLEDSEKAQSEVSGLQKKFEKKWHVLQKKIKSTRDNKKLKKLEREAEKLVQWCQEEISKIENEYY